MVLYLGNREAIGILGIRRNLGCSLFPCHSGKEIGNGLLHSILKKAGLK
jgi:hypothetical protein